MIVQSFKFRFYPTPEQEDLLRRTIGCARLVYNKALQERTEAWVQRKERVSYLESARRLTQWKKQGDLGFLSEVSSVPLQQALRHLQTAYVRFFNHGAGYPRFKCKRNGGTVTFTSVGFRWKPSRLQLAKMDAPLSVVWTREVPCEPTTVAVSIDAAGRWHVALQCHVRREPWARAQEAVGVDLGITSLVTLSTGEKITNPKYGDVDRRRLKLAQRALARKEKGSNNRQKARIRAGRIHARIADRRRDMLHKLTTRLVRENQTIVVEDLSVSNMVKNRTLARSISHAAWWELTRQLAYKCRWHDRTLIKVDRFYPSSKTCSACGFVVERLPLELRSWACGRCGAEHDRDHNAAKNILAAGLAASACGANVRPLSQKTQRLSRRSRKSSDKPRT